MKKIKLFFKNLFRKGKSCMYCGLKTESMHCVQGSTYRYRICDKCAERETLENALR